MTEIRLPQFGMGMTDGTITRWLVAEGDIVSKGDILCDIEAAKTTVEFESPCAGTITRIHVALEQNVEVSALLLEIEEGAASSPVATENGPAPSECEETPAPKNAGSAIATPLAKRVAATEGVDLALLRGSGPNGRILRDDVLAAAPPSPPPSSDAVSAHVLGQIEPRARKAARDLGINLSDVTGTGPGGRIVAEDVASAAALARQAPAQDGKAAKPPLPAEGEKPSTDDSEFIDIKHSMMRKTIARRLTESKQSVPHFYLKASCRVDALLKARASINSNGQTKISVNDLIIRAIAMALCETPEANVTWSDTAVRQYRHVDIAVAVATPRGLVTPVVRKVDLKTIRQISSEVKELAGRGREGKLKPEEYQGGTTSVSNLGMFGVEEFTAIINPPHSTIFAIGASEERVIAVDGLPVVATIMAVTISVDHRAIDGSVGAQLLAAFKAIIEDPVRILA